MPDWQTIQGLNTTLWKPLSSISGKLEDDAIDVVIFSQSQDSVVANQLACLLDESELERAEKFYTETLKNCFIVRRAMLRYVLANYIQQQARDIRLSYSEYGKPFLDKIPVHFNLSHSSDLVVIAITRIPLIGIDIEFVKVIDDMERVAKHHFSPSEKKSFFALAPEQQTKAFYHCWTRKEAFIKADGRGLGIPLDSFDVTLSPSKSARLLSLRNHETVAKDWKMVNLSMPDSYAGALVSSLEMIRINYYEIHPEIAMFS